jgi:hypothetical protein
MMRRAQRDRPGAVAQSVVDQVPERLLHAEAVDARDRCVRRLDGDRSALPFGAMAEALGHRRQDVDEIGWLGVDGQATLLGACE